MIALLLFLVFMVLWLVSCISGETFGRYGGSLAWVCVALLAFLVHAVHF